VVLQLEWSREIGIDFAAFDILISSYFSAQMNLRHYIAVLAVLCAMSVMAQPSNLIFKLEGTVTDVEVNDSLIACPVYLIALESFDTIRTHTDSDGFYQFEVNEDGERLVLPERDYLIRVCDYQYRNEGICGYHTAQGYESTKGFTESTRFIKDFALASFNCCYSIHFPSLLWGDSVSVLVNENHNGYDSLNFVFQILEENPTIIIEVSSHCYVEPTAEENRICGEQRADAVVDYLVSKGVDMERLLPVSYGDTRPKFSMDRLKVMSSEERIRAEYRNNRVVFSELSYDYIPK
jgi:hypothetical protein